MKEEWKGTKNERGKVGIKRSKNDRKKEGNTEEKNERKEYNVTERNIILQKKKNEKVGNEFKVVKIKIQKRKNKE